jgi:hypothetical protein
MQRKGIGREKTMHKRPNTVALAALAGSLLLASAIGFAAGKPTYKWVDKNGVTHYGDSIPPEYASQAHAELNNQGVSMRETARQLTPEEAEAAQRKAAEEQRNKQHDAFLLSTYTRLADIEQLRDERTALVEGQLELARGSLSSADPRLLALQKRFGNFRPYSAAPNARRLPDQLAEEAVRALSDRRSMQETLARRETEMTSLRADFEADIARYRELTEKRQAR